MGHEEKEKSLTPLWTGEAINKRVEKLIIALYMVTDNFNNEEPLKNELRSLGVKLIKDVQTLSPKSPTERYFKLNEAREEINRLLSLLRVAAAVGLLSEMNYNVLGNEFTSFSRESLLSEIDWSKEKDNGWTLTREFWQNFDSKGHLRDNLELKDKLKDKIEDKLEDKLSDIKKTLSFDQNVQLEIKGRRGNIIKLLKDKKEVTIKDILEAAPDFSPKTLQRDLGFLIAEGILVKNNSGRWSRYRLKI